MTKPKGDIEIGYRMVEELYRICGSQQQACKRIRGHRHNFQAWSSGCCPGGFWLAKLHYIGGDVLYVLTGKRSGLDGN